jgi:hypothetical protein
MAHAVKPNLVHQLAVLALTKTIQEDFRQFGRLRPGVTEFQMKRLQMTIRRRKRKEDALVVNGSKRFR